MQKIIPHLWFDNQAQQAAEFYTSVFKDGKILSNTVIHDTPSGQARIVVIEILGQQFQLLDGGPLFKFTEAVSFMVPCEIQEEIDYYWEKLSAVPESEQCGWCKDQFGLSWQIIPTAMGEMMKTGDAEQMARVTQAFLKMKKFDIAKLQEAYQDK